VFVAVQYLAADFEQLEIVLGASIERGVAFIQALVQLGAVRLDLPQIGRRLAEAVHQFRHALLVLFEAFFRGLPRRGQLGRRRRGAAHARLQGVALLFCRGELRLRSVEVFFHLRDLRLERGLLRRHLLILLHEFLRFSAPAALSLRMEGNRHQPGEKGQECDRSLSAHARVPRSGCSHRTAGCPLRSGHRRFRWH